jgi:hypothetical protein
MAGSGIVGSSIVLLLAGLGGASAAANVPDCHAPFNMPPGYGGSYAAQVQRYDYDQVEALKYGGMNCSAALHIAARAYAVPGLKVIRGPQFGPGGYGGPFHVGRWHCFLLNRGSDFKNAKCTRGGKHVRFYDHRDYKADRGSEPDWSGPLLNPNG